MISETMLFQLLMLFLVPLMRYFHTLVVNVVTDIVFKSNFCDMYCTLLLYEVITIFETETIKRVSIVHCFDLFYYMDYKQVYCFCR